jgi:hypothetical protein
MTEKKTKFTPGPWMVGEKDRNDQTVVDGPHSTICTCFHHCVKSLEREMEANARLIAAAPDLLKVCELALKSWFSGEVSEVHMETELRAAIAKATGESNDD